jgi:hypothetical protein
MSRGILPAAVAFLSVVAPAAEPGFNLKSNQALILRAKADQILASIQKTSDDLHLRFIGPTRFVPTWGDYRPDFLSPIGLTTKAVELGCTEQTFEFRDAEGQLVSYQNRLADDLPENKVLYDQPDQPKWSNEQAITIATAFEKIFVDTKGTLLGSPRAEYDHTVFVPSKSGLKSLLGSWRIAWPRIDSKGHIFYGDGITLQIQEGFAPIGVGISLSTPYVEEKEEPIKKADAIAKAREALASKQVDHGFESYADGDSLVENKVRSAELLIVLPPKDIKVLDGPSTGIARLAWEIWFDPQHSKKPTRSIFDDSFAVWIDAYTGKVIGGDAMM